MKKILVLVLALGFLLNFGLKKALAATGTITGSSAYAWGENMGWINFLANEGNISVTDSAITGYAWNSNYGWINLSPSTSGVTNNCSGTLGGYAWSGTQGWISFTGVTINSSGKFTGMAGTSDSTAGRINFDCTNCNVNTDWRPSCLTTPTPTPTSTPSSSTTSTTASTGWAAAVCSATKPGSAPIITNTVNGDNSVTLTWLKASNPLTHYLVAYGTSSGSIEYGNPNVGNADTTSYTVKGLSGGTRYYFKIKAINDCMPGDWSNEVSDNPVGRSTITTAEGFVPASEIANQLFDIALIVDKTQINNVSELVARVTFVSFGKEETPVEMTFTIVDANGKEYYRSVDNTSIQTEGVFNKTFEGLLLDKGKYTLVLTTLYNTNVKDEFKQDFEVGEVAVSPISKLLENKPLVSIIGSGIMLILISWIVGLMRRKRKKKKV